MRIGGLFVATVVLLAGCSQAEEGQPRLRPASPTPTPPTQAPTTSLPEATPTAAPEAGAAMPDVVKWVSAGEAIDADQFHTATRDNTVTQLGQDVAFTTSAGTSCMTDARHSAGALACMVDLDQPPPRPEEVHGEWISGWVDFDGKQLTIGSVHGDPGRFVTGDGPLLAEGRSLRFGDYQCRDDASGLFCVNYAYQSAVRFSSAGIEPFGCLQEAQTPPDVGRQYTC